MKHFKNPFTIFFLLLALVTNAQKITVAKGGIQPQMNIQKNLSDSALLDIVQRQTFRFFWHGAHPVSGLALERSNTVLAEHYWDYINEAWDEPNFSKTKFGPDAGAIGGTGFGISTDRGRWRARHRPRRCLRRR